MFITLKALLRTPVPPPAGPLPRAIVGGGLALHPAPTGLWVASAGPVHPGRYVPNIDARKRSTLARYERLGDVARQVFAALDVRRQSG